MLNAIAQNAAQEIQGVNDAVIGKLILDGGSLTGCLHQATLPQYLQVTRNCGLGDIQFLCQFSDIVRLV